jgi:teichuronic acid biosynthesis glycosyltransferase TuaG
MKIVVSIIIPFYSNINLLKKTVKSVLNQTFNKYEIIIIHDNPKSLTNNFKNIFKSKKNLKIIYNKKNIGAGLSRNKGIHMSKGKYVAFVDSDDIWNNNKLIKQINFMERYKYLATHTSYDRVDINGKLISTRVAKNLDYKRLLNSCDIGLSSVILNKRILKKKIEFPPLKTKEDYVLWLKIAKTGVIFYGIKSRLMKWHNTPDSLSKSNFNKLTDAFKVYYNYEKISFIKSILRVFILGVNFLKKN